MIINILIFLLVIILVLIISKIIIQSIIPNKKTLKGKKYNVTSLEDNNEIGTLRYGINSQNVSHIHFNVAGIIKLNTDLPDIVRPININAYSNNSTNPYKNTVTVNLNNNSGLNIKSKHCHINGLSIMGSKNSGINIYGNHCIIENCYIYNNAKNGIHLFPSSSSNIIGRNIKLNSAHISNILANNNENGIKISNSNKNTLHKNYIGTINGTFAAPNKFNGIHITDGSKNNIIGGKAFKNSEGVVNNPTGTKGKDTPAYIVPPEGNLISGNDQNGIVVDSNSSGNILYGNFIGTTSSGNTALPNGLDGILFNNSQNNSIIGCEIYNNPFVFYNVTSGNNGNGIQIKNSSNSTIQANFSGIAMNNQALCPNKLNGLLISGNSSNTQCGGVIPLGNVISGNTQNGVHITDTATGSINFNTFAGIYAFGGAAPNGNNGLLVDGNATNTVIRTCVPSGNAESGIKLSGNSSYTTVEDVICGTTTNSFSPIPNKNGLTISENSNNNTIQAKASVAFQNVFSGNLENGIQLLGNSNNNIFGDSKIGTNIFGNNNNSVPNGANGVFLDNSTSLNTFTNNGKKRYNVISGNTQYGIYFNSANVVNNTFTNNYIGAGPSGEVIQNISGNFGGNINSSNTIGPNITS